jgi:exosortase D (VPLPA-CTERM-specific)
VNVNTSVCDIDRSTTFVGDAQKMGSLRGRILRATGAVIACSLVLAIYGPILSGWIDDLKINPSYSHGLLLPFVSIYLACWVLGDENGTKVRASVRGDLRGAFLLLAGCALLIVGERTAIVFLTRLSFLILLAALVVSLFGFAIMRALSFPYLLLYLALPLPALVYSPIAFHLQLLSSAVAGWALDLLAIPALREGNIITLPNVSLEVVEACSGIHSLFALASVASLVGYLFLKKNWKRVLLLVSAVPIAILFNSVRLTAAAIAAYAFGPAAAEGFSHLSIGMIMFSFACLAILFLGSRLALGESADHDAEHPQVDASRRGSYSIANLLAVISVLILTLVIDHHSAQADPPQLLRRPWHSFPVDLENWHGRDLSISEAQIQSLGTRDVLLREYRQARNAVPVSLYVAFFPRQQIGSAMHSPLHCIPGAGWEIEDRKIVSLQTQPYSVPVRVNEVVFRKGEDRNLITYWYMEQGRVEAGELRGAFSTMWNRAVVGRSDGCLIRFSSPISTTVEEALSHQLSFVQKAVPLLVTQFLPGPASSGSDEPLQRAFGLRSAQRGVSG